MKKIFLSMLTLVTIFASINAQTLVGTEVEKRNVVLEEFTGIHCQYCPDGHAIANALREDNPGDVVLINIHTGGYANPSAGEPDFRTPFGDAIAGQSGLVGYPAGTVNRHLFPGLEQGSGTAMSRGDWTTAADIIFAEDSYVNVGASTSYDADTRELTVEVELYYTSDSPEPSNFINVALTQSGIRGPQTGGGMGNNYIHNHMLRYLLTEQWGDEVTTTTQGSFVQRTYVYTVPEDYIDVECVVEDCRVSVFVAESHQEILSGIDIPAIDGTTIITATIEEPAEKLMIGTASVSSIFELNITNLLPDDDNFILTLTKDNEPEGWSSSFTIEGETYEETGTQNLEAGVETDFTISVTPDNTAGLMKYIFLAQSESNPNAEPIMLEIYVMANVNDLLVHNQGAWSSGTPSDFEQDYFDGFDYAGMQNYASCNYKTFKVVGSEEKLNSILNLYFNVGWTFPSFTDENVVYLASFLDAGGNLFVAGQDIGWDTWDGDGNGTDATRDFYTNYLHADYNADGSPSNNSVYAYTDEEVFGTMANFNISNVYGGSNMYPDEIAPVGDAVSILKYNDNDSKNAAIRFTDANYKVVYFGFDPSMASSDDTNEIIERVNTWFTSDIVAVTDISVSGEGGATTIDVQDGTLQMETEILPENATVNSVTWSIVVGSANISYEGLLTATTNGTVTVRATANDGSGVTGETDIVISNQNVGINVVDNNMLQIFPNPATGVITLDFNDIKATGNVSVIDITGKTIYKSENKNLSNSKIDLSNLKKGLYLMKIETENNTFNERIILK